MNINIRSFKHSDYLDIAGWWTDGVPLPGMMVEDGTFVLELNNKLAASITVLKTQSKEVSYLEGLVKNPEFQENIEEYIRMLVNHAYKYAKDAGYNRIVCYCNVPKLQDKYERLGMRNTMTNLKSFSREL